VSGELQATSVPLDSRYGHFGEGENLLLPAIEARFLSFLARSYSSAVMYNTGAQVSKTCCIMLTSAVVNGCVLSPSSEQDN
jgi:hypothetical protein